MTNRYIFEMKQTMNSSGMKLKFTVLFSIVFFVAYSQINIQWVGRYTTNGNNIDRAAATVIDRYGNSCMVGTSWNGSNFDIVTAKFDPFGNFIWSASYNGGANGYDEARAITTDTMGNIIVTGYAEASAGNYNIVTIKYNTFGVQQWASLYNGPGNGFDEGYDVIADPAGNVYITGGSDGSGTGSDYVTIKYNNAGAQQWATRYTFTGANPDVAYAIALDNTGNVYVTGNSFGGTTPDADAVTIKYNNAGVQQWVGRYNGPGSKFDSGTDLVVNNSGEVFVCGYTRALVGITNYDYLTLKYNNAGTQQWVAMYNGAANDYDRANAINLTATGNVVVTGREKGNTSTAENCVTILYNGSNGSQLWLRTYDGGIVNYDEGKAVISDSSDNVFVSGYSFTSGQNHNFITIKYDAAGDTIWMIKYNGPGNNSDQAYSMAIDTMGNIFVGGMSKGAGTNEDYAVVKYCQLTATASADTTICLGAQVQLSAQSSYAGIDSVWWLPSTGLSQSNIANPVASPSVTTTYVLYVRNNYGCIDADSVTVTVVPLPGPNIVANGPTSFCIGGNVTLTAQDTTGSGVSYFWNTGDTTQSITVNASGTYSVTLTNNTQCASQSTVTVNVFPLPVINAGNDTGVCASSTVQLCATGGVSYAWGPSFGLSDTTIACPTAGPTQSTTYIVYSTDANGCSSSDTVSVYLYPTPSVPVISQNVSVLSSTPASGYQWYFNGNPITGATSQTYTPTQNGQYFVVITDANGCSAFSAVYNMTDVGMNEMIAGELSVYPNPSNGMFSVNIDQQGMSAILEVVDITGRTVYAQQLIAASTGKYDLQLNGERGMYMVRITFENGTIAASRIIIE
ncbi:MAG: hypothetical protein Fur0041_06470 [Bacteroidia bacterium]